MTEEDVVMKGQLMFVPESLMEVTDPGDIQASSLARAGRSLTSTLQRKFLGLYRSVNCVLTWDTFHIGQPEAVCSAVVAVSPQLDSQR